MTQTIQLGDVEVDVVLKDVKHVHLSVLEPTHNARFKQLLDDLLPHWRARRDELNRAPLAHEHWTY